METENSSEKEKITLNLSSELAEQMEDALFSLRKRLPRNQRKQLTKSLLYELILIKIVENFIQIGDKSLLVKIIDDWTDELSE